MAVTATLRYKAITVKYHGPTNHRGSRMIADDGDGNRITVSREYSDSMDDAYMAAALALCAKMGWHGTLVGGWAKRSAVFIWADFERTGTRARDEAQPFPRPKGGAR